MGGLLFCGEWDVILQGQISFGFPDEGWTDTRWDKVSPCVRLEPDMVTDLR